MAKDINIHLKTQGAEQTKQKLSEVGKGAQQVGRDVETGQQKGAAATERATGRLGRMGRVLSNLKSQVVGFVAAWLSIQTARKALDWFIQKLQNIQRLQKQIYESGLPLAELGQALEIQTGTIGRQQYWTEQILAVQKAGALPSPAIAKDLMVAMDIGFQRLGGLQSEQVMELAKGLAPAIGALGFTAEQVGQLFKFAGVAGVKPTEEAYYEYFAKVLAAFRSSLSQEPGLFLAGLQKGVTPFITEGGTLEEGLALYSGAVAVSASEQLAATLVEQATRLSTGGYTKPRQAIEKGLGVKWRELSMDERIAALLRYVGGIPQERRGEILAEQGFAPELVSQIGKISGPKTLAAMAETREKVAEATAENLRLIAESYLDFFLAKQRVTEAEISLKKAKAAPEFADWQTRMDKARDEFEDQNTRYVDRWIHDTVEPHVIAMEEMLEEVRPYAERGDVEARRLFKDIDLDIKALSDWYLAWPDVITKGGTAYRRGFKYTERLKALKEKWESEAPVEQELPTPAEEPTPIEKSPTKEEKKPIAKEITVPTKAEPAKVGVPTEAEPQQLEVPIEPVPEIQEAEPVSLAVPTEAEPQQLDVPVKAVAKQEPAEITEVGIPVEGAEQQVDVPVRAVAQEVPVEITEVGVPTEAESQQVEVPVEAVAKAVPAEPVGATAQQIRTEKVIVKEAEPQVVHHHTTVQHVYDNSIKYFPRVGDDLVGPRFPSA